MGNEPSQQGVTADRSVATGMTTLDTSATAESIDMVTTPRPRRRIIKAVKPTPSPIDSSTTREIPSSGDKEEKTRAVDTPNGKASHVPIVESPSVARESELEAIAQQKQERMDTWNQKQKARRAKKLEESRQRSATENPNAPAAISTVNNSSSSSTTSTASTASTTSSSSSSVIGTSTVQPNPMSRFLSAFSVLPAHPEHKRPYKQVAISMDSTSLQPEKEEFVVPEKRQRSETTVVATGLENNNPQENSMGSPSSLSSKEGDGGGFRGGFVASKTAGVVAIAVAFVAVWFLRAKRAK